jgi:hypothetical protein
MQRFCFACVPSIVLLLIFKLVLAVVVARAQGIKPQWERVTAHAAWQARDSQGELVYKNQLWILGGWFSSQAAPPRDVWSSSNGKDWKLVTATAPWKHSDLPMSMVFKNKMWMMGGWYNGRLPGHSASSEVWSSVNGATWKQETSSAQWSPRAAAAIVEFKEKIWLLGGTENYYFGDHASLKNDVWNSSDGKNWQLVTASAAWAPRAYHQAVVLNGKIFVMGGGNYVPQYEAFHDVWSSEDGVNWQMETAAAPWHPRIWFSSVVYRNRMWILGGWSNNPYKNWSDVWYSHDGKNWTEFMSDSTWKERHELSAYVFNDRIWIAGGMTPPLTNDVWSLYLPKKWFNKN